MKLKILGKKIPHRYRIYDFLSKTAAYTLSLTAAGFTALLVVDVTYYFVKQRPERKKENRLLKEKNLAEQQVQKEQERLIQERLQEQVKQC